MKHHFFIRFMAGWLMAAGCTACSSSSVMEEPQPESKHPIILGGKLSKAVVESVATMSNFSVWGWRTSTMEVNPVARQVFSTSPMEVTNQGTYSPVAYWIPKNNYEFYALHPFSLPQGTAAHCTEGGTLTVTNFDASRNIGASAIDLMTCSAFASENQTGGGYPAAVPLTFQHELARVTFQISTTDPDPGAVVVSDIHLYGLQVKGNLTKQLKAASLKPEWEGTYRCTKQDGFFQHVPPLTLGLNRPVQLLADLLMIPQTFDAGNQAFFELKYTHKSSDPTIVPDKTLTPVVPLDGSAYPTWEKGKHYIYSAVIPDNPLQPLQITVTVKKWNDKPIYVDW